MITNNTFIDSGGVLYFKSFVGKDYINSYNPYLLLLLRSNHDARFHVSSSDEMYYAVKYSIKYQHLVDIIGAFTFGGIFKANRER